MCARGDEASRGGVGVDGLGIACNSIMRLNESERKQRPFIPSQKTMALLVEAFGMITWADVSMVHATVWNSDRRGRWIMYLHHKVVEFFSASCAFSWLAQGCSPRARPSSALSELLRLLHVSAMEPGELNRLITNSGLLPVGPCKRKKDSSSAGQQQRERGRSLPRG